ncbi:MAG: general secretion pathway protein GspB [Aquimonas sp.]|nr:general secretion pathway protein GspB [Aquimonas sp.]
MSLILEALKKSEAERRLGRAPGLMDSQPLAARRRSARWQIPAALTALLAVAVGAYWLGQRGGVEGAASNAAPLAQAPTLATAPTQDAVERAPPTDAMRPAPPAPAPAAPVSRLPSDPGFRSTERESVPQHAQPLPPPPTQAAPAAAPPAPLPAPAPEAAPAATIDTSPPTTPTAAPEPARELLPSLSQLNAAQREGLPPLRTSMHVYTDDPSTRVVIIDGRRLREGETVAPGLQLQAIERDASVLDYHGLRFRLPRP